MDTAIISFLTISFPEAPAPREPLKIEPSRAEALVRNDRIHWCESCGEYHPNSQTGREELLEWIKS